MDRRRPEGRRPWLRSHWPSREPRVRGSIFECPDDRGGQGKATLALGECRRRQLPPITLADWRNAFGVCPLAFSLSLSLSLTRLLAFIYSSFRLPNGRTNGSSQSSCQLVGSYIIAYVRRNALELAGASQVDRRRGKGGDEGSRFSY